MVRWTTKVLVALFFTTSGTTLGANLHRPVPHELSGSPGNPQTPEKIALGKQLYFDPRLSSDGTVSCNSCHNVMAGGEDNLSVSVGVGGHQGSRSAPTVWNAALMSVQFWDGRASSLEEQAKGPLINPIEMGMKDHDAVVRVLESIPEYRQAFQLAFPADKKPVAIDNIAKAIAAFERTLLTPDSRFDRYISGKKGELTPTEQHGYELVQSIGCTSCHSGVNFAGPELPEGTGFYQKFPAFEKNAYVVKYRLKDDAGRFMATKNKSDRHMWRVPSWRNVALTAPYFHNGSVDSLDEAVRVMAKTQLDRNLSEEEVTAIVSFLGALTGQFPSIELPRLPPTPGFSISAKPKINRPVKKISVKGG